MRKTLEQMAEEFGIQKISGTVTMPCWEFVLTIPEFKELSGKTTTSRWHMEKNMFDHTKLVCEEMQKEISSVDTELITRFSDKEKMVLMFAALFHDIGKCRCENNAEGKLLSNGHPAVSEKLCRKILWDMDIIWRERICEIVRWHDLYCTSDISDKKLAAKLSQLSPWLFIHLDLLKAMFRADDHGSVKPDELKGSSEKMVSRIEYLLIKRHFHTTTSLKNFGEFTVYVMCGLPGSGKSTWANDKFPNLPVVSRDIIREELGMTDVGVKFMGTPEQEDLVSKISAEQVNELCRKKQSFIYDNMNSREKYRKSFLESIRKYNPVVRVIYLEVNDLSILESRRPEIAAHDADAGCRVFERMVENMEFPRPYEYDTIDIYQDYSDPTVKHEVEKEIGYIHLQDTKLKCPNDTKQ